MTPVETQAEMLANRARKTFRRLRPAMERKRIGAFRVYDWDIPEIRMVIDWYEGHLVCAEYARAQTDAIPNWLETLSAAVARALEVPAEKIHLRKRRTRPQEGERYARLAETGARLEVREGDLKLWVNLDAYLDTGLFTDHRETRAAVRAESQGARLLNLFCYTGTFTCAAALGGASATTSVDVSGRYLDWARDNLALNGLDGPQHSRVRQDARAFLGAAARAGQRWTLCVLDPPSFSTREGEAPFDLQRDHPELLVQTLAVLEPGGVLWFSTNHQRFEPRFAALEALAQIAEKTSETLPPDHRRQAHRSFRLVKNR